MALDAYLINDDGLPVQNCVTERRYGALRLSMDLVLVMNRRDMQEFFSQLVPLKCEHDYGTDQLMMTAASELFDVVPEGNKVPEYNIQVVKQMLPEGVVVIAKEEVDNDYTLHFKAIRL